MDMRFGHVNNYFLEFGVNLVKLNFSETSNGTGKTKSTIYQEKRNKNTQGLDKLVSEFFINGRHENIELFDPIVNQNAH